MRAFGIVLAVTLVGTATAVWAKDRDKEPPPQPEAYRALVACRTLTEPAQRLACFDREVAAVEQATASGEIVMTDKATMRETRRGLFGFRLPSLKIFGGGDDDDEVKEVNTTIASVSTFGYGSWRLTLADGAVWEQTDTQRLVFDPEAGDKIRIKQAAMGTFMANIDGQHAIRVRRMQ